MTDGKSEGSYSDLESHFKNISKDIPIYSILFGDADTSQLKSIAELTKADVFDSNGNLIAAFKKARGYN
jgi:Ca-activated chloride channel family protein